MSKDILNINEKKCRTAFLFKIKIFTESNNTQAALSGQMEKLSCIGENVFKKMVHVL